MSEILSQENAIIIAAADKMVSLGSEAAQLYIVGKKDTATPKEIQGEAILKYLTVYRNSTNLSTPGLEAILYELRRLSGEDEFPVTDPIVGQQLTYSVFDWTAGYPTYDLRYARLSGATYTGAVILAADATDPLGAVTLGQMQTAITAGVVGLWDDRGNYDASVNTFPASGGSGTLGAILKGDIWTVSVAGTLGGVDVTVGDTVRALTNTPGQTGSNWAVAEGNIGTVSNGLTQSSGTLKFGGALTAGTSLSGSFGLTLNNSSTSLALIVSPTVTWAGGGFAVGISPTGTISQTITPSRHLQFANTSTISVNNALHDIISVVPTIAMGVTTGSLIRGIYYNPTFTGAGSITHYAAVFRSGSVGIGNITPVAYLQVGTTVTLPITPVNVASNLTTASASGHNINGLFFCNQTAATTGSIQGVEGYTTTSNSSGSVVLSLGMAANIEHSGAGTLTEGRSITAGGNLTGVGTITSWSSFWGNCVTSAAGTITNYYGIYLATPTVGGGGAITNRYGVYQQDPAAMNALYGYTGIGGVGVSSTFLKIAAGTTAKSQMNLTVSAAPTSPVDGDVWREDNTNNGLKARINGVTKTIQVA